MLGQRCTASAGGGEPQVEDLRYVTADLLRADGKKGALLEETLERLLHSLRDVPDDTRNYLLQFAGLSKQAKFNRAFTAVIFGNRLLRCTKAKRASIVGRRQSSFCLLSKQCALDALVQLQAAALHRMRADVPRARAAHVSLVFLEMRHEALIRLHTCSWEDSLVPR